MLPGWAGRALCAAAALLLQTQVVLSRDAALRVVTVTPNEGRVSSSSRPVEISGDMSITATFSHAMIALGADFGEGALPENLIPFTMEPRVEGKWRWVSTSVIRFDPSESWPAELDVTLSLKADAKDFSGNEAAAESTKKWEFKTPSLTFWFDSVTSKLAQEATGGQWDAMAYEAEGPEVPPDGVIRLDFSDSVDAELLGKSLEVVSSDKKSVPVEVAQCPKAPYREPDQCVELTLKTPLATGQDYQLQLPVGSRFHSRAGPLKNAVSLPLRGLLPFVFPFHAERKHKQVQQYRRQRLWIRHGLAENVSMQELLRLFEFTPAVANLNLTKKAKAEIELFGDFEPGTSYKLKVLPKASILDGFGLPLETSECTFQMSDLRSVFMGPQSQMSNAFTLMPRQSYQSDARDDDVQWPVMFRGKDLCINSSSPCAQPQFAQAAAVTVKSVKDAIMLLTNHHRGETQSFEKSLLHADNSETVPAPLKAAMSLEHLAVKGVQLVGHHKQRQGQSRFHHNGMPNIDWNMVTLSDTIMSVALLDTELIAWVLRQDGSGSLQPISDMTVTLYGAPYSGSSSDVHERAHAKTDADGIAKLSLSVADNRINNMREELWATLTDSNDGGLVLHRLNSMHMQSTYMSKTDTGANYATSIITDRGVYKPGDNVLVKVYVHHQGGKGEAPASGLKDFKIHVQFSDYRGAETQVPLTFSKFGTAEANISVPANATYGHKYMRLKSHAANGVYMRGGHAGFVIADPRPPTVSLIAKSTQDIIQTNGTHPVSGVELSIDTTTLSGVPVGGAEVTLRWRIPRRCSMYTPYYKTYIDRDDDLQYADGSDEDDCRDDEGEETLVTESDGHLDYVWKPDSLTARPVSHRDSVALEFEWVGPTRERLNKELNIPIAFAKFDLSMYLKGGRHVLPGIPFTMQLTARQLFQLGGKPLVGKDVSFSLHEAGEGCSDLDNVPKKLSSSFVEKPLKECRAVTDSTGKTESCDLTVPSMGHFAVVACMETEEEGSDAVCSVTRVGRNQTEWEKRPLSKFLAEVVHVTADKAEYAAGERPTLSFYNPRADATMLYAWSCAKATELQTQTVAKLPVGRRNFTLPAMSRGSECQVSVMVMSPGGDGKSYELPVPSAHLFDPRLPEYVEQSLNLKARREVSQVEVKLTPENKVAEPGSEQKLKVELQNADGSPARGEVCIFAVDRAMLDLQPHPVVNLTEVMKPFERYNAYIQTQSSLRSLVSADVLNFTKSWLMRLAEVDPWLLDNGEVQWYLHAGSSGYRGGYGDIFDKSPEEAAAYFHSTLTKWVFRQSYGLGGGGGMAYEDAEDDAEMEEGSAVMDRAPAPMAAMESAPMQRSRSASGGNAMMMKSANAGFAMADESASSSAGAGPAMGAQARIRSDFVYTPLFRTLLVDGSADVTWKLPDNIGKFEIRAYAVTEETHDFGGAVAEQVVRQKVALTSSVPRITRVGDEFSCGVTVTATDVTAPMKLELTLEFEDGSFIELGSQATSRSTLDIPADVSTTKEVTFGMRAKSIGEQKAIVTVSHEGKQLDRLELVIPVLATQHEVYVATSIAIPAHSGEEMTDSLWEEGVVLPDAVNGSGHLHMSTGVGNLPAVKGLVQSFLPVRSLAEYPGPSAVDLLCSMASVAALAPYPHDAVASQQKDVKAKMHQIIHDLETLTTDNAGLRYSVSMNLDSRRPDVQLNSIAVFLLRRLNLAKVDMPGAVKSLQARWISGIENGLEIMVEEAINENREFTDYGLVSMAKLALGAEHMPWAEGEEVNDLWQKGLSELMKRKDKLSMRSKAELAIIHMLPADQAADTKYDVPRQPKGDVLQLVNHLATCLRVSGRTAYVTASPTSAHAADVRTQGTVLTALSLAKHSFTQGLPEELPLANLDKLAKYVARGVEDIGGMSALSAAFGLADYDSAVHNTEANVNFTAWVGQDKVYVSHISTENSASEKDMALTQSKAVAPMLFEASGVGEVSVGLGIRFIPAKIPQKPVYRGIDVQRVIQLFDQKLDGPKGTPLSAVSVGDLVTVSLQISVPDDTFGLVVEDWLPAGLEALDPNVGGGDYRPRTLGCENYWMGFYSFCPYWDQETKKDRVVFHTTYVNAGTHTVTYQAMAVTRGTFVLPPAKASAVFEPEVMGMCPGGAFMVDDKEVEVQHTAEPRHMCPGDCSGRGTCDTAKGKCTCFAGSSGDDCSETPSVPILELDPSSFLSGDDIKASQTIVIQAGSSRTLVVKLGNTTAGKAVETLKWLVGIPQLMTPSLVTNRRLDDKNDADGVLKVARDDKSGGLILSAAEDAKDGTSYVVNILGSTDGVLFGKQRVVALIDHSSADSSKIVKSDLTETPVGGSADTPTKSNAGGSLDLNLPLCVGAALVALLIVASLGVRYRNKTAGWQQVQQPEAQAVADPDPEQPYSYAMM